MRVLISVALSALNFSAIAQQAQLISDTKAIFEQAKAATVVVLAGEGAGRLRSLGTGVLISNDGVILTALHTVKGAAEVQVRLASGDVFDHVELLGADERRDVAALKISLTLVQDPRVADVLIQIDRPLFTYVHTFVIVDKRTSIVLGSGKVTAFDGTIASGGLAKDIMRIFASVRLPTAQSK